MQVARKARYGGVAGRRVVELQPDVVARFDAAAQRLEGRGIRLARRVERGVVPAQRHEAARRPAQIRRLEVVVAQMQLVEGALECIEGREQRLSLLREQRLLEGTPCGQRLHHEVRAPRCPGGILPAQLARQDAVFARPRRVEPPQPRDGAFDAGQGCRGQRHREQPLPVPPHDLGLGEARAPLQARQPRGVGCRTRRGEASQARVGRLQRPQKGLYGRVHRYSVLTLTDPMLSMATSSAAEAL